jgi:hypothetical protein
MRLKNRLTHSDVLCQYKEKTGHEALAVTCRKKTVNWVMKARIAPKRRIPGFFFAWENECAFVGA